MNIREDVAGAVTILHLEGRLDSSTAGGLEQQLPPRCQAGGAVVVDLAGVHYVSSAGLRVFLKAAKAAKVSGAKLVLAGLSPGVQEVFDVSGFTALFTLAATAEEAAATLA